jgi:hypothetical protein
MLCFVHLVIGLDFSLGSPGGLEQLAPIAEKGQDFLGQSDPELVLLRIQIRLISSIFSESCGLWSNMTTRSPLI